MDSERDGLKYEIVFGGARSTSKLLYLDCNKCMYLRKYAVNNLTDRYVCYENKKCGCNSAVFKKGDLVYAAKTFENKSHENHEELRKQFDFKNSLKRKVSKTTIIMISKKNVCSTIMEIEEFKELV